jgi:Alternative oxidase
MVVAAQAVMVPLLSIGYAIRPTTMHRFVGYLEETACHTYVNIITHTETPGTHLHTA